MKKILLTGLGICLASGSALAAEAPKLTIEGRMDFQAGTVHQKKPYMYSNPGNPAAGYKLSDYNFTNDTKLDFKIDGKINSEMTYGGFIRANTDTSASTSGEVYFGNKTMIYFQHNKFGRIEAGSIPGAGGLFEMDTVNLAKGSYGIDGFWSQWVTDRTMRTSLILTGFGLPQADTRGFEFITSPNLLSNYSGHSYSDANKINFFTKPLKELTLGVAFIPDLDMTGTVKNRPGKNSGPVDERANNPATFRNIVSGGFVYEKMFNKDWGIKTGIAGEYGKSKISQIRDLRAFEAGLAISYSNIKVGATYGNWFNSFTYKNKIAGTKQNANYFTLAANQTWEKLGYAVTYMNSRKSGGIEPLGQKLHSANPAVPLVMFTDAKDNKFQNLVFDVEYKLAPGFMPYATLSMFEFKESAGSKDCGYVGLLGTRLLF